MRRLRQEKDDRIQRKQRSKQRARKDTRTQTREQGHKKETQTIQR